MTSPDGTDGFVASATQDELTKGYREANRLLQHALILEEQGLLNTDPTTLTPERKLEIEEAKEVIADLVRTAKGGTE